MAEVEKASAVLTELDEAGVLTLTLNRPERNNAWNLEMETALHVQLERASEDREVRAVVITGAGRSFCPGLDTQDLEQVSRPGQGLDQRGRRPMTITALVPKPVICAINGGCAGLGLITALMSDVRFTVPEAKITTAFARRGLPAEESVSWILPRIVGHAMALDLLLSGRVVQGVEAAAIGLVHGCVPRFELLATAQAYARDIAEHCSPLAVATAKAQVYRDWQRSLAEARVESRELVGQLKEASSDFREGVMSFVEKRAARFEPLSRPIDYHAFPDYLEGQSS